jgi:ATP-binding cassette subfamily B protein
MSEHATAHKELHLAGARFVGLVVASRLTGAVKDYRQRLVNVRVMLPLRCSLFDRLLHLPLPKLWDMKTGGIVPRLTGDVDTTTGLLQMCPAAQWSPWSDEAGPGKRP